MAKKVEMGAEQLQQIGSELKQATSIVMACRVKLAGEYGSTGRLGKPAQYLLSALQQLTLASAQVESIFMQHHPGAYMEAISRTVRAAPDQGKGETNG